MKKLHRLLSQAAFALVLALGLQAQVRVGGAWTAALSAPGAASLPFLGPLGVPLGHPEALPALGRILDSGLLKPSDLESLSPERQAGFLRESLEALAERRISEAGQALSEDAPAERLEEARASLSDFRPLLTLLPRDTALQLLDSERHAGQAAASGRSHEARLAAERLLKAEGDAFHAAAEEVDRLSAGLETRQGLWDNLGDETLRHRGKVLGKLVKQGSLDRGLRAKLAGARKAELGELRVLGASAPDAKRFLFEKLAGRPAMSEQDRRDLEALKAYVPGLDPGMAVWGAEALELRDVEGGAAGWANHYDEASGRKGFIFIQEDERRSWSYQVAIHEGFHQGDLGYEAGTRGLRLWGLDRSGGRGLAVALIEGYTEHRARVAFHRLLEDGMQGRSELGRRAMRELKKDEDTGSERKALERLEEGWERHSYHGYVQLVRGILALPGGEQAMEAFVRQGKVAPLAKALGPSRLRALGVLADLRWRLTPSNDYREDHDPDGEQAQAAASAGLPRWLLAQMQAVVRDPQDAAESAALRAHELARALAWEARRAAESLGPRRRAAFIKNLRLDLDHLHKLAADPLDLAEALQERLARGAKRSWLHLVPDGLVASALFGVAGWAWMLLGSAVDPEYRGLFLFPLAAGAAVYLILALQQALRSLLHRWKHGLGHPVLRRSLRLK